MITDMEMNSTYRGAVEVFNLCRNLRSNDVLFAECIRTFSSCTLNGQLWMYRLDALQQCKAMQSFQVETFLPPTKRPNVRTDRSSPNAMDMYGFRPFRHPWKLLSAYEFTQAWRGEPLMIPSYYTNKGIPERSAWTEAGIQLSRTKEYKEGKSIARPGVHYCVVEAENEEYCTFPEYPADIYAVFRHAWILLRKKARCGCGGRVTDAKHGSVRCRQCEVLQLVLPAVDITSGRCTSSILITSWHRKKHS
jgi:hypothetical protein